MAVSKKLLSDVDANQISQKVYNPEGVTLGVDGFVVGKVGRKITRGALGSVETYTFSEDGVDLYTLTITYTDNTFAILISVERTA